MSGRVALVTGGAGAIGSEICRALAAAGHRVAVTDLVQDECDALARDLDGLGVALDVTRTESVKEAMGQVAMALGPVEILVSCAGWDRMRAFVETDEEFQRKVIEINYAGPLRITRAALPTMIERGWGRIVYIASDAGRVGSSFEAIYSGTKGGIIAFAKAVAREVARNGVTANTVCPGPTDTPLLHELGEGRVAGDKLIGSLERAVPMKRLGRPTDVAPAVAFLASDEAEYVTGQTLSVSGGLTMA